MEAVKSNPNNTYEMVLKGAMSIPGVRIDRETFLFSELKKYYDTDVVQNAIENNPAYAGIDEAVIDRIATESITFETNKVSAISFAAGMPGGFAMLGTVPADTAQYFAHVLRILQKLVYLYGWDDLFDENGMMDAETSNLLTLFLGIMFGVQEAGKLLTQLSLKMAPTLCKRIAAKPLTKGFVYPIVKKVAALIGAKMTKDIFAKGVSKIVPLIGGAASGGLTYITYRPMANKLKNYLSGLDMANPEYYRERAKAVTVDGDFYDEDEE